MSDIIARRTFVKLTGAAASALLVGGLAGCSGPEDDGHEGKGHRGKGKPRFKGPLNRAQKVDTAPDDGEALAKFVVVSDTHLDLDYQPYVDRVQNMFQDIAANCPDNDSIIVVGDITNNGELDEFNKFHELVEASGFKYPDDFTLVIGNHDQYDSTEGAQPVSNLTDQFREQAGISDQTHPYYDRTINGVHLIVMGPDRYPDGNWAHFGISDDQIEWMDKLVGQDEHDGTISFVLMHEPLYQTVLDTEPGDFGHEWSLSDEDNENLHNHLRKHDNVVFFTGHTHAMPDTVQLEHEGPLYVGTGSIAYCVLDPDGDTSGNGDINQYGSLGWEVTVWTSCVRFRMRNFLTHEYEDDMGSAIYQY